jgi:basic amino acid/polyamine antiporter, APA family
MPSSMLARKPVSRFLEEASGGTKEAIPLKRELGAFSLIMLGIGGIIGTGIFVLTGVAAVQHAGPGVSASFAVAGLACAFAALCYAELATMLPVSGSAYSFSYATLGELVAWIIGWDLVLEYAVAASAVAVGWSGYFQTLFGAYMPLPDSLLHAPCLFGECPQSGIINLPAFAIIMFVTGVLVIGVRESAASNTVMVLIKTAVVVFVIAAGAGYVDTANWSPYAPQGWGGIMTGAAVVFFAYIGFDGVTTAAEEARNPERDLPIGILGSLAICTVLYLAVALVITGMVPLAEIDVRAPLATAFKSKGLDFAAGLISVGAIVGLTSVLLVLLYGQSRIFYAMSRDGLLPPVFSRVHPKYFTPHLSTLMTGGAVAVLAALLPLEWLVELVSIGTLFAFILVSVGVIVLRQREPERPRAFRCPLVPWVPIAAILSCAYLMASLHYTVWLRLAAWLGLGLAIYFLYGRNHSRLQA